MKAFIVILLFFITQITLSQNLINNEKSEE
jgi:hypothetical protein